MADQRGCACNGGVRLLFSCSGASDIGEISDRVARKLTRGGFGRMFCLAGISGRVSMIMDNMKMAGEIWAIDGCSEDCAKRTLELAGFSPTKHLRVTECGFEKGKSPATDENVMVALTKARANP